MTSLPHNSQVIRANKLDVVRLQATVAGALESEARYDRENAAKLRAVAQKVQTYAEFEGMVQGAHIKPMTEDVTKLELARSNWSSGRQQARGRRREASRPVSSTAAETVTAATGGSATPTAPPRSGREFTCQWFALAADPSSQYRYLLETVGAARAGQLFAGGMESSTLGCIFQVLAAHYRSCDSEALAAVLAAVSRTPRFTLACNLLADVEQAAGTTLLSALDALPSSADRPPLSILRAALPSCK